MPRYLSLFLSFLLTCTAAGAADSLIWPLDIEISPSSSYAEFRGMRFHGGIDLRTRKTTGFPVKAVADGFVSRIKVQHRGFGYAIYVDHPAQKIRSVFGHLEDFAGPMGDYTRQKLAKMNARHGIDDFFGPEKFPVKQGQVIGYTGETGIGPAHLHFELRTFADEPLSPTAVGLTVPDTILPLLVGLTLDPLSRETRINGQFLPCSLPLQKISGTRYAWATPIEIAGKAGIQAGFVDPGEGGNKFGVEEITVFLDEQLLFRRLFDKYSYDENDQCAYIYDYHRSSRPGTGYVYTLFKWPMESLSFSKAFPAWGGALEAREPGNHVLKIVARDFGGNIVQAEGPVRFAVSPIPRSPYRGKIEALALEYQTFSVVVIGEGIPGTFDSVVVRTATGEEEVLPIARNGNQIQIAFPIDQKWEGGGFAIPGDRVLPAHTYLDAKGGTLPSGDGAQIRFPAGSLNFPVLARLAPRLDLLGTKALPARSPGWELFPDRLVTHKAMEVEIGYTGSLPSRQLGIYSPAGGGFSCEGGTTRNDKLTMTTRASSAWVVLEDRNPPRLKFQGKRVLKKFGKCWVYHVGDTGEGVDYGSLAAKADGRVLEVDSDPDKGEVYVMRPEAGKGKTNLVVSISDHAGNVTEVREKR